MANRVGCAHGLKEIIMHNLKKMASRWQKYTKVKKIVFMS